MAGLRVTFRLGSFAATKPDKECKTNEDIESREGWISAVVNIFVARVLAPLTGHVLARLAPGTLVKYSMS